MKNFQKIIKKVLLIILLLIGGSMILGIIQEEVGFGFLHGLVLLGIVYGFIKIVGIDSLWKKRRKREEKINP